MIWRCLLEGGVGKAVEISSNGSNSEAKVSRPPSNRRELIRLERVLEGANGIGSVTFSTESVSTYGACDDQSNGLAFQSARFLAGALVPPTSFTASLNVNTSLLTETITSKIPLSPRM